MAINEIVADLPSGFLVRICNACVDDKPSYPGERPGLNLWTAAVCSRCGRPLVEGVEAPPRYVPGRRPETLFEQLMNTPPEVFKSVGSKAEFMRTLQRLQGDTIDLLQPAEDERAPANGRASAPLRRKAERQNCTRGPDDAKVGSTNGRNAELYSASAAQSKRTLLKALTSRLSIIKIERREKP